MKVLVLSCSTGGGHNSCARYIKEEFGSFNIECDFYDFFDLINSKAKEMSSKLYLFTLNNDGKIFKNFYKIGEAYSKSNVTSPVYLINKMHKKKIYDFICENGYDLVITTHLFPALTLTAINKDKKYNNVHFIFVATDYEPCPFMVEAEPDYFIIQKGCESRFNKTSSDKLITSGIPVSSRFVNNAQDIRNKYNITCEKVILVMLGSMGFGNISDVILRLVSINNVKIFIVCGSNKKLYDSFINYDDKVIPLPFINNVNDYIYSSDVVISKPGGLSTTEIATIRKPLIHMFAIPGIEEYNEKFFEGRGMSRVCNIDNIKESVIKCFDDTKFINNQKKYIYSDSAYRLVKFVINNYH